MLLERKNYALHDATFNPRPNKAGLSWNRIESYTGTNKHFIWYFYFFLLFHFPINAYLSKSILSNHSTSTVSFTLTDWLYLMF